MEAIRLKDGNFLFPADRLPALREIYRGVDGGPDRAIVYGLSYLLARGYKYLALVENDILVTPEWLPTAIGAMQRATADGLRVGAATVRTFNRRSCSCGRATR